MNKSESIGKIALALSKLQGEIKDADKNRAAHNHKYADLSQVLDITRPLLAKYELAVTQLCGQSDEKITVETVLMHSSDQWISSTIEMCAEPSRGNSKAQAVGGIITYARRYALAAIIGITQTDTDAALKDHIIDETEHKKINENQVHYLKELIDNDPLRIEKIIKWYSVHFYPIKKLEEINGLGFAKTIESIKKSLPKTEELSKELAIINSKYEKVA